MKKFYVYVLQRKDKTGKKFEEYEFIYEPFYVGKGYSNDYYNRLNASLKTGNKHKMNIINKVKEIEISIFYCDNELDSFNLEKKLIQLIGRNDIKTGTLVNMTNGGDGPSGSIIWRRKIAQYNKDGNLLKVYDSFSIASEETGIGNLSRASSIGLLAGGFFWRKVLNDNIEDKIDTSEYFKHRMHNGNIPRKIIATSDKDYFFNSIKDASKYTNVLPSTIIRACRNNRLYNEYKFKYND